MRGGVSIFVEVVITISTSMVTTITISILVSITVRGQNQNRKHYDCRFASMLVKVPRPGRHTTVDPGVCVFMLWFAGGGA